MTFHAVIFDRRGTLVSGLSERRWVHKALALLEREADPEAVVAVLAAIVEADGPEHRLDAPGMDTDAALHRRTFFGVLEDAGLDRPLVEALYAVESDPRNNPFAEDVAATLEALHAADLRLAVLSDIHFDLRPAFHAAGLSRLIDVFMLSFEQGLQKPSPLLFTRTLTALGTQAHQTLMVGDRAGPDGPAVEQGIPTLLLPPLEHPGQRRLHHVLALTGLASHRATDSSGR
jgi:FMN phosphatase YigB (HAD superfamily)